MNHISVGLSLTRDEYKQKLAENKLREIRSKGKLRSKDFAEKFIAEQKLLKSKAPQAYAELNEVYGMNNLITYYRAKFGRNGVTELVKRFSTASELKEYIAELKSIMKNFSNKAIKRKTKNIVQQEFTQKLQKKYYESMGVFCSPEEYKILKAKETLRKISAPDIFNISEYKDAIIAELKTLKASLPVDYQKAKKVPAFKYAIHRYKKKYRMGGVTEIVQKFMKSATCIQLLSILRSRSKNMK